MSATEGPSVRLLGSKGLGAASDADVLDRLAHHLRRLLLVLELVDELLRDELALRRVHIRGGPSQVRVVRRARDCSLSPLTRRVYAGGTIRFRLHRKP